MCFIQLFFLCCSAHDLLFLCSFSLFLRTVRLLVCFFRLFSFCHSNYHDHNFCNHLLLHNLYHKIFCLLGIGCWCRSTQSLLVWFQSNSSWCQTCSWQDGCITIVEPWATHFLMLFTSYWNLPSIYCLVVCIQNESVSKQSVNKQSVSNLLFCFHHFQLFQKNFSNASLIERSTGSTSSNSGLINIWFSTGLIVHSWSSIN